MRSEQRFSEDLASQSLVPGASQISPFISTREKIENSKSPLASYAAKHFLRQRSLRKLLLNFKSRERSGIRNAHSNCGGFAAISRRLSADILFVTGPQITDGEQTVSRTKGLIGTTDRKAACRCKHREIRTVAIFSLYYIMPRGPRPTSKSLLRGPYLSAFQQSVAPHGHGVVPHQLLRDILYRCPKLALNPVLRIETASTWLCEIARGVVHSGTTAHAA